MTDWELIRSDRRTLALEITPDARVLVRAPRRCSQREIERFVAAHEDWIGKHLQRVKERKTARDISPEEEQELRNRAAAEIPPRVAYYAAQMGLTPAGIRITSAAKRFGSCSGKNRLCFSWRLMLYPPQAVDYVVVHELAHIRHHDHSPAFYALVARYLPDYRQREKLLRQ